MRRLLGCVLMTALVGAAGGCDGAPVAPPISSTGTFAAWDGTTLPPENSCRRAAEGCACAPGQTPVRCHLMTEAVGEARECQGGTMRCIGGRWSACVAEVQVDGEVGRATGALISSPVTCNSCSPHCSRMEDYPDGSDLTSENSDGVEYSDGGITLTPPDDYPTPPEYCDRTVSLPFAESSTINLEATPIGLKERFFVAAVNDAATAFDETGFVGSIAPSCPAVCSPGASGTACAGCPSNPSLSFAIQLKNDIAPGAALEAFYPVTLALYGQTGTSTATMQTWTACIYVPAVASGGSCRNTAAACTSGAECCSGVCATDPRGGFKVCASTAALCVATGGICTVTSDCCAGNGCSGGVCTAGASCQTRGTACTSGGQCCTGLCTAGLCAAAETCRVAGETCSSASGCCSGVCTGGVCAASSFCRVTGEPCSTNEQCCAGTCNAGFCKDTVDACLSSYERCERDSDCCNWRCDTEPATGAQRCMGFSGCRTSGPVPGGGTAGAYGDVCSSDAMCCSGECNPDTNGDNRCERTSTNSGCTIDNPVMPDGEVCNSDCQCESGHCNRYGSGTFGQRCGPGACAADGDACGSGDACCSGTCRLHPEGWRCGAPPSGSGTYAEGSYTRVYDATGRCPSPRYVVDWSAFRWTTQTPSDSSIVFEIRTAATVAGLASAGVVEIAIPTAPQSGATDLGALLESSGQRSDLPFVQVTARLLPSMDGSVAPLLTGFEAEFYCDEARE